MPTEPIPPALTSERWRELRPGVSAARMTTPSADMVDEIIILNAALPDDSPYKVSGADVINLEAAASAIDGEWAVAPGTDDLANALHALAAKLRALLPLDA
jgi:hypothetical protein